MYIYTFQNTYSYFIRSLLIHPPALPILPISRSQKWEPHVWGPTGALACPCHWGDGDEDVSRWYSYSSLWL